LRLFFENSKNLFAFSPDMYLTYEHKFDIIDMKNKCSHKGDMMQSSDYRYIAIDLKSFYASVECVDRGLDPLSTNLVVADASRTDKTICLAVSPSLKAYGIPGRARLFEVIQRVKQVNSDRRAKAPNRRFSGKSSDAALLEKDPSLELDFIIACPQMARYMQVSTEIFKIYMNYVSPEDMHVYSVDEVFIDAARYLRADGVDAHEFAMRMIRDVLGKTGITATAGIGTNLYLCKVAMDIVAKRMPADKDGVRIAELDEYSYRKTLWDHRPITDFWRVGAGYAERLEKLGLYTMGDVARCSRGGRGAYHNEEKLYKTFGVNAELLIDHAWGYESCTIADIKAYKPSSNSISSGQVLSCPYSFEKGRLIVREMTDALTLDLVERRLVTDQIVLTVGYDTGCVSASYGGVIKTDRYGRAVPKEAHGTVNLGSPTSSTRTIIEKTMELYDRIVDKNLTVRRMYVVANHIAREGDVPRSQMYEQLDIFTNAAELEAKERAESRARARERRLQTALIGIKRKFGKNCILKGMNYLEGATARERNGQIGGHRA